MKRIVMLYLILKFAAVMIAFTVFVAKSEKPFVEPWTEVHRMHEYTYVYDERSDWRFVEGKLYVFEDGSCYYKASPECRMWAKNEEILKDLLKNLD